MYNKEAQLPAYPVLSLRPAIQQKLEEQRIPVIEAPPGSGKSTLVPFFLLDAAWRQGRTILLLQPRRPAVRALAARLKELGDGQTRIGYITRYERSLPKNPDIIVMTEGIFTRRLLEDPEAGDTAAVILDEFHERSLATDLACVLARQCRDLFRPDLRLLVMSATLNTEQFSADPFSVLQAQGSLHPLTIHYRPAPADQLEQHGTQECRRWINENQGSILFFLPGEAEIRRAASALHASQLPEGVEVHPLYGRLSPQEQSRAIAPPKSGRRKIVIATNIAETSLTIEGIRCVVDSGLRRRTSWDPDTGLSRLQTVRISVASATQRAGRAGRLGPGTVIRLWESYERLDEFDPPEIKQADLSGLFLTLAVWGDTQGSSCPWPDPPDAERRAEALELLRELAAIDEKGVPTPKGSTMARMPVAPRLASMLTEAATHNSIHTAALTAAILEHGDPLRPELRNTYGADLGLRVELLQQAGDTDAPKSDLSRDLSRGPAERVLQEAERLERLASGHNCADSPAHPPAASPKTSGTLPKNSTAGRSPGWLLLGAYPDRIARRTEQGRYRLASGPEARLIEGQRGFAPEWIVAGALHRGQREGLIYLAAALSEAEVQAFIAEHARQQEQLSIDESGLLRARRLKILGGTKDTEQAGGLLVSSTPIAPADLSAPREAFLELLKVELLKKEGLGRLSWSRGADDLRRRIAFLREVQGEKWPDVSDETLGNRLEQWLGPFLPRRLKQSSLKELPLAQALRSLLPWELQHKIDQLAPEQLTLPSGTHRRLRYEGGRCILAARIQQLFGLPTTPRVAGVPVEVELLSPAGRPVQVTRDLHSFWQQTYPQVRKELRGRYPKHFWPEDPLSAEPTDRSKPRGGT
ncbi:MAG: ATP-dependent helicase HrpB [Spirochaetia bacterium]|nr:ATP-dependent helicase HrpB [Spirochaetia bacterium]